MIRYWLGQLWSIVSRMYLKVAERSMKISTYRSWNPGSLHELEPSFWSWSEICLSSYSEDIFFARLLINFLATWLNEKPITYWSRGLMVDSRFCCGIFIQYKIIPQYEWSGCFYISVYLVYFQRRLLNSAYIRGDPLNISLTHYL